MSRILDRYVSRELAVAWLAVAVILCLILFSAFLGDYLSDVSAGKVPPNLLVSLVGLRLVRALTIVLPVAFFFAALLAFGRLYHDNEMVVLNSCGVGSVSLLRPMAWLLLPGLAAMVVLSFWLAPLAAYNTFLVQDQASKTLQLAGLTPGQFQAFSGGEQSFYAEHIDAANNSLTKVFLQTRSKGRDIVAHAASGHLVEDSGRVRYLILRHGDQIAGLPGQAGFRRVHFEANRIQLNQRSKTGVVLKQGAAPTVDLWRSGDRLQRAELHWRIASPMTLLVLAVLAVPLARTSPRQGRFGKLLAGILLYVIYSNLLSVGRLWLESGVLPVQAGLWWVHALFLALAGIWLWRAEGYHYRRIRAS